MADRARQARRPAPLGQIDIVEQRAGRGRFRAGEGSERIERSDGEMRREAGLGIQAVETAGRLNGHPVAPVREGLVKRRLLDQPVGDEDFRWLQPCQHRAEVARHDRLDGKIARRHVEPGQTQFAARLGQRREIAVGPGVEQRILGQRAGGHDPNDIAPDQRLRSAAFPCLGRIFHLFAHRNLEPGADQTREIGFRRMDRHAAHRHILAGLLAPFGQCDVERACRGDGIVEEQFVEVAHPVEHQAVGMRRLHFPVVRQHGRQARFPGRFDGDVHGRERAGPSLSVPRGIAAILAKLAPLVDIGRRQSPADRGGTVWGCDGRGDGQARRRGL